MQKKAPLIAPYTSSDIAELTQSLLRQHLKDQWGEDGGEVGKALTHIFAHYCGLVVDRINRAPEKNFLAFLDLLGNSLVPPRPAEVPVTFLPHAKLEDGINIPSGTRIQAEPADGASEPVIFETTRDLWVSVLMLSQFVKQTELTREKTIFDEDFDNATQLAKSIFDEQNTKYIITLVSPNKKKSPIGQPVTLFFYIDNPVYDPKENNLKEKPVHPLKWKYALINDEDWDDLQVEDETQSNVKVWEDLLVEDETQSLTQTGAVTFLVPEGFVNRIKISIELPAKEKIYDPSPVLQWVAVNTVNTEQAVTIRDEVLASSNGGPGQNYFTARKPVLDGVKLQVMERPITRIDASSGQAVQTEWIYWEEVSDFYGSKATDRHFVLNHTTGEVRFGDGQNGMIPPPGTRNLRMKTYRAGGGQIGNVPADSMKTLVAGAKGIDKVVNLVAATGGAEAETYDAVLDRAPKALRHRGRAVTYADYEDLAQLASTEVARALCVPLLDLSSEPYGVIDHSKIVEDDKFDGAGKVSLIIVPHSDALKPLPSQILMQQVENYLHNKKPATSSLVVVGPLYLTVKIIIDIELESLRLATTIKRQLEEKLAAFLHPLTGRDGNGWPFGRKPNKSDIYRLVKSISGIKYTKKLKIEFSTDSRDDLTTQIEQTYRFLVCSGEHEITPYFNGNEVP